jgi:hypothetical protein
MAKSKSVWIVEINFKTYDSYESSIVGIYSSESEAERVKNNWWDFFNKYGEYRKGYQERFSYIYEFDQIICYEKPLGGDDMLQILSNRIGDDTILLAKSWNRDKQIDELLY